MSANQRVVIVGGGISGLATADALRRARDGVEVVILEAADRPGGKAWTFDEEGYLYEAGPNGFLDNVPATLALARRVGLGGRIQRSSDSAAKRYLFLDGRLMRLPEKPPLLLLSKVLSWPAKARMAAEPFLPARRDGKDESLAEFATRRLGREVADRLVGPMASGIYAGDPERLSVAAAFPKIVALEREHGSLVRGALALGRKRAADGARTEGAIQTGPGGALTSFVGGLATLLQSLADRHVHSLRLEQPVETLAPEGGGGQWAVETRAGETLKADAVVLAVPPDVAARSLQPMDVELGGLLGSIEIAPVAVTVLGFESEGLGHDVDGFGFLVPRGGGVRLLGCLWSSSIFPGRAPRGHVLIRCIAGGALDPTIMELDDEGIVEAMQEDLRRSMGITAAPTFVRVVRWPRGIPQYNVGHLDRVARIDRAAARHPGLFLTGNALRGVAFNACIDEAPRVAERVLRHLDLGSS